MNTHPVQKKLIDVVSNFFLNLCQGNLLISAFEVSLLFLIKSLIILIHQRIVKTAFAN